MSTHRSAWPDELAGLALLVVDLFLRALIQRPAQLHRQGLGHEHTQVGMGAHVDGVATAAHAAGALRRRLFAQPGARQRQRQFVLAQAGRTGQQQRVAALRQQAGQLALQPGGERRGLAHGWAPGATQPRAAQAARTACHTASTGWSAGMRAKRPGRVHGLAQHQFAQLLGHRRAAGFAGQHHGAPAGPQGVGQAGDVGRLAGTVDAFEAEEQAWGVNGHGVALGVI